MTLAERAWSRFKGGSLWRLLRRAAWLRSLVYLSTEVARVAHDGYASPEVWEGQYALRDGRWSYESNPAEQAYFAQLLALIDRACPDGRIASALEIGTGDGNFTVVLAPRCEALLSLDISANALARARGRCTWPASVRFAQWDVRRDPLPGRFDLIVMACVLETVHRPWHLSRIRDRLVAALAPGGHLLVVTTRHNPVVEASWWGRRLLRGRWIIEHFGEHAAVSVVARADNAEYAFGLVRKTGDSAL